jgi:hypothetical protein
VLRPFIAASGKDKGANSLILHGVALHLCSACIKAFDMNLT